MPPRFPLPPEDLWPELHDRDSSLFAELLAAYFHDTASALELAQGIGLSLRQLATWRNSAVARDAIDQIRAFEEQRARDLASRAASAAVERLVSILAANTNTESARKAASLLLRLSNIARPPTPPPPRAGEVPARPGDAGGGGANNHTPPPHEHDAQASALNPTPPPLDASMPPASMPSQPSSAPRNPLPEDSPRDAMPIDESADTRSLADPSGVETIAPPLQGLKPLATLVRPPGEEHATPRAEKQYEAEPPYSGARRRQARSPPASHHIISRMMQNPVCGPTGPHPTWR
ncbi:MAG: hypothetical protein H6809_01825 [Phycisphaeraceae bacterium]|nr:hypothetical protein [Phycisphaeraceae bacterium]